MDLSRIFICGSFSDLHLWIFLGSSSVDLSRIFISGSFSDLHWLIFLGSSLVDLSRIFISGPFSDLHQWTLLGSSSSSLLFAHYLLMKIRAYGSKALRWQIYVVFSQNSPLIVEFLFFSDDGGNRIINNSYRCRSCCSKAEVVILFIRKTTLDD